MAEAPRKLGDVIEVPPIRLVVQLADAESTVEALQQEILQSFVVTDEIEGYLRSLLSAFQQGKGVGCFVKGNYGSGKSHFLSFLSLLLRRQSGAWDRLPATLRNDDLKMRDYLQIKVALQNYTGALPLEDIVGEAAEDEVLRRTGSREALSDLSFLLENFNSLLLERHPEFLSGQGWSPSAWHEHCRRNRLDAGRRVATFLAEMPQNPLRLKSDRSRTFTRLFQIAEERGCSGVVLLIDELSEFLKAKPSAREFNDDLRYLQFLGELTEHKPCWVVASLQEMLEQIGFEEGELYTRIKERYRLRFSLSSRHVEDLIEKRLVTKKPNASPVVEAAWRRLTDAFPDQTISQERFARIYPVHPATLSMLENLMTLFSQHRGVVDFVHTQLAGSSDRGIPGLLDQPTDRLLTCESIFDHFRERMEEQSESAPYVTVAYRFLEKDILRLFTSERDRELALRCVKIVILTELSPLEPRRTARELANLVMRRVSSVDASVNYAFLQERILDRLVAESSYVSRSPSRDNPSEMVYGISLKANAAQHMEARLRQVRRGMDVGPALWSRILHLVDTPLLPLAQFGEGDASLRFLYWQFTRRSGAVILGDLRHVNVGDLTNQVVALDEGERDWLILLGTPHESHKQQEVAHSLFEYVRTRRAAPAVAAWIPREPSDAAREACLHIVAQRMLRDQAATEGSGSESLVAALDTQIKVGMSHLREVVLDCYYGGSFGCADGQKRSLAFPTAQATIEMVLVTLLSPSLEAMFPQHAAIKPLNEDHQLETLDLVWKKLVVPGSLSRDDSTRDGLERCIQGVCMPLGLVQRRGNSYHLADPSRHPLLSEMLSTVVPGQAVPYMTMYRTFRKGPWGLAPNLFALCMGVLVHQGFCSAYKEGRAVHLDSVRTLLSGGVDAIGEGHILERADRERLPALEFLLGDVIEIGSFSLATQRDLWKRLIQGCERLTSEIEAVRSVLQRHRGFTSFRPLPVDAIQSALDSLRRLAESVNPRADSRDGLAQLLSQVRPETLEQTAVLVLWRDFFASHLENFKRLHHAMTQSGLEAGDTDLAPQLADLKRALSDIAGVVERGEWEQVWRDFNAFLETYLERYAQEHDAFYAQPNFKAWPGLRFLPEFQLLEKLSRLYTLPVENDVIAVRNLLDTAPRPCSSNVREGVVLGWHCTCNYRIGQPLEHPSPENIRKMIHRGLSEYEAALSTAEARERIEVHAANLRQVGKGDEAGRVAALLVACGRGKLSASSRQGLSHTAEDTLDNVNRALAGRVVLVERRLQDFQAAVEGRLLSPPRLRELFEKWLGPVAGDAYIRVQADAKAESLEAERKALMLQAEMEDTLPLMTPAELVAFLAGPDAEVGGPDLAARALDRLLKTAGGEDNLLEWAILLEAGSYPLQAAGTYLRIRGLLARAGREVDALACYGDWISELPVALDRLQQLQFQCGAVPEYLVEAAVADVESAILAAGRAFEARTEEPLSLSEIASKVLGPLRKSHRKAAVVLLIVDAMRWDVWQRFRSHFEAALGGPCEVQPALSLLPTRTLENRAAILGELPFTILAAGEKVTRRADVLKLLESGEGVRAVHFNFVDERLHHTELPLSTLLQELEMELKELVLPYLAAVPRDAIVLVLADHGFMDRAGHKPPYWHGGDTMFERIVPCAVWRPGRAKLHG